MNKFVKIVFAFIFIIFASISFFFINNSYHHKKNISKYKEVVKEVEKNDKDEEQENKEIIEELSSEFNNKDIIGTIKIDGTTIDDVLVQGKDNDYYLRHSLDGKYNVNGTVFMDYRNNINADKKFIIYGHSYRHSDKGFSQLFKYKDKSFYDDNPYITLNLNGKETKWVIFSVKVAYYTDDKYIHTKIRFNNEEEFNNHISWLKEDSFYDTNMDVSYNNRILTIQTCYHEPENSYFIVNAMKIK